MLVIIIIVIFCFIMLCDDFCLDCGEAIFKLVLCILFSIFIALGLGGLMPTAPQDEVYEVKTLYAINDENNTEHLYYLDISDNSVKCMTSGEKGEKEISVLPMGKSSIVEGEYDEPYLEIYTGKFKQKWYWLFGLDVKFIFGIDIYYIFYIPQGSIVYEL